MRLVWLVEAAAVTALALAARCLPPDRASATGRRLFEIVGPRFGKRGKFRRNLELAFPEKDDGEIQQLVRRVWGSTGSVGAEYPHLRRICGRDARARIETLVKCDLPAYRSRARAAVFVTAHLANWEVSAAAAVGLGIPLAVLYSPAPNPLLDVLLRRYRRALGCAFLSRDTAVRAMMRWLADGGSLGLLADHRVDAGEPVPFFGRDKLTTLVPARLALRYGADLVPVAVERLDGARFRVSFHAPIPPPAVGGDATRTAARMMRAVHAEFEEWIRAQPEEWFCGSRLWPKDGEAPARGAHARGAAGSYQIGEVQARS